jgi:hypothetical protein
MKKNFIELQKSLPRQVLLLRKEMYVKTPGFPEF